MTIRTLKPGLLVSLATSIRGLNVKYNKTDTEAEHVTADGQKRAKWETERTIRDPEEHERAKIARGKCRTLITGVCAWSEFGLLCPEEKISALEQAIAESRKIADEFNATAELSRIRVNILKGKIASNDLEAVRAINGEVRDLLEDTQRGIRNADVKVIRDAANRLRGIGAMLSDDAKARTQVAIDAARDAARKIAKAGEQAAIEIDKQALATIDRARTAFLDLDEVGEVAVPQAESRAVDFEPVAKAPIVDRELTTDDRYEAPPPKSSAVARLPEFEF